MPCYEAPPPYEGKAKKNAEKAVNILCEMIKPRVRSQDKTIGKDILIWFIEHREVDFEIATCRYYGRPVDHREAYEATLDIDTAKQLLSECV